MAGLRDEVIKWWKLTGRQPWDYEITRNVCLEVNRYFEMLGQNPTPRFREEVKKKNNTYIKLWVMGCHFDWLNPRRSITN